MNLTKKILMLVFFILFSNTVLAFGLIPFEWSGLTTIKLDKQEFGSNELITGKVIFSNLEKYPSLGTKIVLHLVRGEYDYPSQLNNKENILFEEIIDLNFVLIGDKKEASFSFKNPGAGEYRIDAYFWVVKSKSIGGSNILYNPISKEFKVFGENKKEEIIINRALTKFEDVAGPVGFLVEPNAEFSGVVVVDNLSTKNKSNLFVEIKICEWATPFCENNVGQKFKLDSIHAGERGLMEVTLRAPSIPSAYEIELILYEENEIESIYKNRVIVKGGTAKVRKIGFGGVGEGNYFLDLVLVGSPDHFTYPNFENFETKIKLLNENESVFLEKKELIEFISAGEIIPISFELGELDSRKNDFSKICYDVEKEGVVFDASCFEIDLNQILYEYDLLHPQKIIVTYNYDDFSKSLLLTLEKKQINARIKLFDSDNTYFSEFIESDNLFEEVIQVDKLNLFLLVDDLDLKEQQLIPINLELMGEINLFGESLDPNANILGNKKCTGVICGKNQSCDSQTEVTIDGECCYTKCVDEEVLFTKFFEIPLITWLAVLLVIITGLLINEVIIKKREKK